MPGFAEEVVAAAFDVAATPGPLTLWAAPQPIPLMVRRFQCPHCRYRRSKKTVVGDHIGRCWYNPEAHGCKTCRHFNEGEYSEPEVGYAGCGPSCDRGVNLDGRALCASCGGFASTPAECDQCGGNGSEVKPGPIVHCPRWEAVS